MILFLKLVFIMSQVLGLAVELSSLLHTPHWQTEYMLTAVFGFRWAAISGLILLVCNHEFSGEKNAKP